MAESEEQLHLSLTLRDTVPSLLFDGLRSRTEEDRRRRWLRTYVRLRNTSDRLESPHGQGPTHAHARVYHTSTHTHKPLSFLRPRRRGTDLARMHAPPQEAHPVCHSDSNWTFQRIFPSRNYWYLMDSKFCRGKVGDENTTVDSQIIHSSL
jgi:hypothetical protein